MKQQLVSWHQSCVAAITIAGFSAFATPVSAQVDLSGNWRLAQSFLGQTFANGPPIGDFMGLPLNKDGKAMAETVDAPQQIDERDQQCQPYLISILANGPGLQLDPVRDPVDDNNIIGWRSIGFENYHPLTIWTDGRKGPPPRSAHTWSGFATGEWRGDTLAVTITNIHAGWLLRNGAPSSDRLTINLFLTRQGDRLNELFVFHDPVYLSAPWVQARTLELSYLAEPDRPSAAIECLPAEAVPEVSDGYHAPRYLPGKSPHVSPGPLNTMLQNYRIPPEVALGGQEQMYPEYQKVLRTKFSTPEGYCQYRCCSAVTLGGQACPVPPQKDAVGSPAGLPERRQ